MNAEQKQRAAAEANDTVNMSRDCEHGQLARSCNICDLERELKAVTEQRDKLLAALTEIAELDILKYHHAYAIAKGAIEEIEALK